MSARPPAVLPVKPRRVGQACTGWIERGNRLRPCCLRGGHKGSHLPFPTPLPRSAVSA